VRHPSLGKPVLVMRECTERPEAVEVGTDVEKIVGEATRLLTDDVEYTRMARQAGEFRKLLRAQLTRNNG
jgi:UDP-N-acetylglucosamine 2-epimerase (non-hydrolysing)